MEKTASEVYVQTTAKLISEESAKENTKRKQHRLFQNRWKLSGCKFRMHTWASHSKTAGKRQEKESKRKV